MSVENARSTVRTVRWVVFALLIGSVGWSHVRAQQSTGTAPQKRQRINTIIERLEQGGVVDRTVRGGIEMEHAPFDIVGLKARLDEFAKKRKPNGQLEQTPVVRMP